jgi:geranylgeranyl diphosphate synthase type II
MSAAMPSSTATSLATAALANGLSRIEGVLDEALSATSHAQGPPLLAAAMRHAVFPGGARIRPRLCLSVAAACGDSDAPAAEAAAAAIELLHCASLVHDDLPCFDNAETRRGLPSVHVAYGEPLALLAGDALIVLAFETIARRAYHSPRKLAGLIRILTRAAGAPFGIAAGQAWESEPRIELGAYHRAKTGALFAAASSAGALAAGADALKWRPFGERLGEAFQVADDIRDMAESEDSTGKPAGQDLRLGRPSAALDLGITGALARLDHLIGHAVGAIPPCPGAEALKRLVRVQAERFLPPGLQRHAA